MKGPSADLDAKLSTLLEAVHRDDRAALARTLQAIEQDLEGLDPMLRGLTYAQVQATLGRSAKAAEVLEDLAEVAAEVGVVHHQLGRYRREVGDAEGALAAFTRATELSPLLVQAWVERGVLLDAAGEHEGAVDSYRKAVLTAPEQPDAWRNLGNSLAALASFDEALEAYRTAAGLLPGDPTVAVLRASVHMAQGDLERANAELSDEQRADFGEVVEVSIGEVDGLPLSCRFFAAAERREALEHAAERLLRAITPMVKSVPGFPMKQDEAFVVERPGVRLLCDLDAILPLRWHRFFDASQLVERVAKNLAKRQ